MTSVLPNFLVVGAAKSGTTTLASVLSQHPDVFMADPKELSHFVEPQAARISNYEEYLGHFSEAAHFPCRGEASVAYLADPSSPARISSKLGSDIKIVIILRAPWKMAYSLWGHMRRIEAETLDFDAALDVESDRINSDGDLPGWQRNFHYFNRACYADQVDRYLTEFGKERTHIIVFEKLVGNHQGVLDHLWDFLEIRPHEVDSLPKSNPSGVSRVPGVRRWSDGSSLSKRFVKGMIPVGLRQSARRSFERINRRDIPMSSMSSRQEERLKSLCLPDVTRLSELVGHDFSREWY